MAPVRVLLVVITCAAALFAADARKEIRNLAKQGSTAIPQLQPYLASSNDTETRLEAVKALVAIGTQHSLDPLIAASRDNDPEIQIRATDGLVNFYVPGYVKTGLTASLKRAGTRISARFTDTNDQVIDPFVQVRPEVIDALGKLARGGVGLEVRANAARAAGVLRGRAAVPDLLAALKTKDSQVLYECLVAFQKIRDPQSARGFQYLVRDLDEKVQIAAIEGQGLLLNRNALPDLVDVLHRPRSTPKVRRAALTSIAMMPDETARPSLLKYLTDAEEGLRGAAAEGLGRLKNLADTAPIEKAWNDEKKASPRVSMAFALAMHGRTELSEFSPLQFLINELNSKMRQGEAMPLLAELARDAKIRQLLYPTLSTGTKDEKIFLAQVLARSGGKDSEEPLNKLTRDTDAGVAQEALRALRTLRARL